MAHIPDNSKKHNATLVATFDQGANHVLITHKRKHSVSATYQCALDTGELDGDEQHELTTQEIWWLKGINDWVEECYRSV